MMKTIKGYSMIVLVIAISVILILVSSAVSVLQVSREKTAVTNFIFDITTVEEEVQDFYIRTGTLPIKKSEEVNMEQLNNAECPGIITQLHAYDNEKYYNVDLSQLGTISVKDSEREYIVNEGSLKVYAKKGIEYSGLTGEDTEVVYYTLTSNLVNGLEQYVQQEEEILIVGNPVAWSSEAELRVILPKKSLEASGDKSWENWSFKWDFGPKTEEELAMIPDDDEQRNFKYGDLLKVKSNGIYSIYVKNPDGKVTLINANVTKIDDISPSYDLVDNNGLKIQVMDNETGIKNIKFKTLKNYNQNLLDASASPSGDLEGRTNVDYYLLDGLGKDLMYDLSAEINLYTAQRDALQKAITDENTSYTRWQTETDMDLLTQDEINEKITAHNNLILDLNTQLSVLNQNYPYLQDIYGTTEESRLVLYVEDYAGNVTIIGENGFYLNNNAPVSQQYYLSTEILAKSYNISLEGL